MRYEDTNNGTGKIIPETSEEERVLYKIHDLYDQMQGDLGKGFSMKISGARLDPKEKRCLEIFLVTEPRKTQ